MLTILWVLPGIISGLGILALMIVGLVEGLAWLGDRAIARLERRPSPQPTNPVDTIRQAGGA